MTNNSPNVIFLQLNRFTSQYRNNFFHETGRKHNNSLIFLTDFFSDFDNEQLL